jgi:hypothetical protein
MLKLVGKNSKYVLGSLTLGLVTVLNSGCSGCSEENSQEPKDQQAEAKNKILTIVEKAPGKYVITDEAITSGPNKAIITDLNGTTRVLNEEEMKKFAEEEFKKVENNTSNLTSSNHPKEEGLSMGEVLLAGAAGALLGGVVGNMLSNNSNYQANQRNYAPASYNNKMNGKNQKIGSSSTSKNSFFGSKSSTTAPSSSSSKTVKGISLSKSSSSSSSSKSSFFGG